MQQREMGGVMATPVALGTSTLPLVQEMEDRQIP